MLGDRIVARDVLADIDARATLQSGDVFFTRATGSDAITNAFVKQYKTVVADKKFRVQRFRGVHRYRPQHESHFSESKEYRPSTCKCFDHFASTICKHIIGLAHLNKLHQIPSQCKAVLIGTEA
ncbi:unnamed protein product [Sphagnum balticum]